MPQTRKILKTKDNVTAQLNAGIGAATTSIVLKSGEGAQFPTTYSGSATSGGSSTTLNCTGIQALGVSVGQVIENLTDGSYAVITAVATNSVTTTRLKGGSDNTWQNADEWAINRFVITLIKYDTDGTTILKREKVLIKSRSTDTLTVATSGRGFDGSTGQTFDSDDYVYLFTTSAVMDGLAETLAQVIQDVETNKNSTVFFGEDAGGDDTYEATITNFPDAYAKGQLVALKAATANTGACTININSLGAKSIKIEVSSDPANGDIAANEVVLLEYDGTNFQIVNRRSAAVPVGQISMWGTPTAPTGWLLCNGAAVSRATYATLFAILNSTLGTVTITIASPGVVTLNSHGLATGDAIYLTTTGALPTGLSVNTQYWVIKNDANSFWLATSLSNALAGTKINTSGTQSGTHTATLCPYGVGDGSTTFNLPNLQGRVPVGSNPSTDTEFAGLGQAGGAKTHQLTVAEMPSHSHTLIQGLGNQRDAANAGASWAIGAGDPTGSTGGDQAHNNLQPYIVLNFIIKT